MPSRVTAGAVALATLALLAGSACAVPIERAARQHPDSDVPFDLLDAEAAPLVPAPEPAGALTELCFVKGDRLVQVTGPVDEPAQPLDVIRALASPPASPAGLRTTIVDDQPVGSVTVRNGVAVIDLAPSVAQTGLTGQLQLVAQLVCTLTGRPGVGQVSFQLDGTPVEVPAPDGSLVSGPVAREDYASMIGPPSP